MITGGMVEFRRSLASSFLFRFFVHVASQLEADQPGFQAIFPPTFKSAAVPFHRPPVQGLQYYSKVPGEAVVGQPTRHMAADLQVTPACPPPSPPSCLLLMLVPVLLLAFCMCLYLSCLLPPACPYACPSAALLLATFCQPVVIQLHTDGPRSARQVCRCATVTIIGLQWSIGLLALSVNAQDALASS